MNTILDLPLTRPHTGLQRSSRSPLSRSPSETPDQATEDVSVFGYVSERQLEQWREELLQKLGLTEEDLGEMEPVERPEVEKFIEDMIHAHAYGQIDSFDGIDRDQALEKILVRT